MTLAVSTHLALLFAKRNRHQSPPYSSFPRPNRSPKKLYQLLAGTRAILSIRGAFAVCSNCKCLHELLYDYLAVVSSIQPAKASANAFFATTE